MRERMLRVLTLIALFTAPAQAQAGKDAYDNGRRFMRENKADKAEKEFERALAADETNAVYHYWLGQAVGAQAQDANPVRQGLMARRTRVAWERAVALDPEYLDAREALVEFYLRAPGFMGGGADKARAQQREIARRSAFRGHLVDATIATVAKDTAAIERAYLAAIAAAPDSARAVTGLAQRHYLWGRLDAAFTTLENALKRRPTDIALRYHFGRIAALSGAQLARGEQLLRGLTTEPDWVVDGARPSRAAVHYRLGMILEKQWKKPEARAQYERAIALDPEFKPAKDALQALR